jgi:hypothetical protein
MSEQDKADRQKKYANAMTRLWERSAELRRTAEAKGPMKEVYSIHCHAGSIYMHEDAAGVFWLDLDGDFRKVEHGYADESSPKNIEFMRSKGVPEETIRRVVKQCEKAKAEGVIG